MTEISDTSRIDFIERERAKVESEMGVLQPWKVTVTRNSVLRDSSGETLREAIDRAMQAG